MDRELASPQRPIRRFRPNSLYRLLRQRKANGLDHTELMCLAPPFPLLRPRRRRLVRGRRLSGHFEIANQQHKRNGGQRNPPNDSEAIHKCEQAHLMLQLLV